MIIDLSITTALISAAAFLFSVFSWNKNRGKSDQKEIVERTKENTTINMKLDAISANTTDIKNEVSQMRREINSHNDKIIKLEESCKSAHHRLDGLEARLNTDKEA
jgi:peptidoglycan hydrolase CwlO-like protein